MRNNRQQGSTIVLTRPRSSRPLFIHYNPSPIALGRNLGVKNPNYQNPRCLQPEVHLTHSFWASPARLSFSISRCSKASNAAFLHFQSHPWSIFLVDLSSSISSSNILLFRTSLHLLCYFSHFDPVTTTVSLAKLAFYLFFLVLRFLP
jgi:hypothetical protein